MDNRVFKVSGRPQSLYHGKTPVGSALKAFNAICTDKKPCSKALTVTDLESGKKYSYNVIRKSKPRTVNLDGQKIHFRFSTKAKAIAENQVKKLNSSEKRSKAKKAKSLRSCIKKCLISTK